MKMLVRATLLLGFLLVAALLGGGWWLSRQFERESVQRQLQAFFAGTVSLESSELRLLDSPTRWSLKGLTLSLPDESQKEGGSAPGRSEPVVRIGEVLLEVSLMEMLRGVLDVGSLRLESLEVNELVSPEGESTLAAALRPLKGGAAPSVERAADPKGKGKQAGADAEPRGSGALFRAEQLGLTVRIREAGIVNGQFFIHNRVNKTKTRIEGLHLALKDIDVSPSDLKAHNQALMELRLKLVHEGRGKVAGEMTDVTFARLDITGQGRTQPFDPETGEWSPVSEWELTLQKGSALAGYMTLAQASPDAVEKTARFGLALGDLPMGGTLLQPAVIRMAFHQNVLSFREDARFEMDEYEVRLAKGSWVNPAADAQELEVRMVCGESLQQKLTDGMLKNGLPQAMADSVIKAFLDETTGRLSFDVRAAGKLTKPEVKPAWDKALERVLKEGAIEGLLKGLGK